MKGVCVMAKKNEHSDINKKLRSLTREQANALGASLNSVYINAEKDRKKKEATQKKSGK